MEEKKLDKNTIIGFGLIFLIVVWIMYNSTQTAKKEQAIKEKITRDSIQKAKSTIPQQVLITAKDSTVTDSVKIQKLAGVLGSFAYSATLPSAKDGFTTIQNDLISLKIANKGGYIAEAKLLKFDKYKKNSGELVSLISKNNADLSIALKTADNRILNTKDLFFEPTLTKVGDNQILSMKLKAGENEFLEYKYVLKPNEYMLDFDVRSQGLNKILNTSKPAELEWNLKAYNTEKSVSYENRYAEIHYGYENGKDNYVGQGTDKEETPEKVSFIAYRQHFFTSILLTDKPFETSKLNSASLVKNATIDTVFTKQYKTNVPLAFNNGELDYKMNWYYGPTDYKILSKYEGKNLDRIIQFGWGIFGWINRFIFFPLFGFLSSFIPYGIAIIIFTIIIKLAMSPITFKSFLSQAKMKVLRPEIAELGEKYKKDPMKKQQETMKVYNSAGVNPMAGCIPALIQLPFMYASFQFFPSSIALRQKSFLWAEDLSSFDAIVSWKQNIPFLSTIYGNHISLFAIMAAIAIFFYMKMTSGDNAMAQPQQEGMPDMTKIMKMMIYISPLMMLIFFNQYGSGLSLYNFMSNLITIGIMLVIKKYFIDSEKIHAKIQMNKTKPKVEGKFQKKLREVMEQAEEQKKLGKK
ncbi:MAG: membrane protein insertase YidC [Flavobacterium sp.]|nr:membrane protein insertase YidC [Flavobacterium sp.]